MHPPVEAQEAPLLSTKLHIPPVGRGQVRRPRLLEQLDVGLGGSKLTLVSAPAGFGKTTLVSEWVHRLEADRDAPPRVVWLALDEGDNDPVRFWRYVIAALQETGCTIQDTLAVWGTPSHSDQVLLASLINDIVAAVTDREWMLVLDDYHLVKTTSIHDGIEYLLDHIPAALHLVIITREDPPLFLSRLRGRGQLVEIRAADLRFTPQETTAFLNVSMGLDLAAQEVSALEDRTEGWIVGLQMAALSLRGQSDVDQKAFVAAFAGDDRYVADYLVDEVLRGQPSHIQHFLVETSMLDRLCGPLCDAVLGQEQDGQEEPEQSAFFDQRASPSQAILEDLFESNLFIVPLDNRRYWFRYHQLFAGLLCDRLESISPERIAQNHRRASLWHEKQGFVAEAISHALAAGMDERTISLVERHSESAIRRGENWQQRQWIEALPIETIRSRPLLCLAWAWALMFDPYATEREPLPWIERALELSSANPRLLDEPDGAYRTDYELIRGNAYAFRIGEMRRQGGQPQEVVAACLEALTALPKEAMFARGILTLWLADAYDQLSEGDAAKEALAQAAQFGLAADGKLIALVIAGVQVRNAWAQGDLHTVTSVCRQTLSSVVRPAEEAGERLPYACHLYAGLGRTLLSWNDLEQAEPLLLKAAELAQLAMQPDVQVDCCRDLAVLNWVQVNYQEAHAWMDRAMEACPGETDFLYALRARIWLAQAENDPHWLDRAIRWADGRVLEDPGDYSWELQSLVRVRIAQYCAYGKPDLVPVLAVLDEHLEVTALDSSGWRVQVLAIRALLLQALGRTREALHSLEGSLEVAAATGRVTVFLEHGLPMYKLLREAERRNTVVDHTRRILAAFEVRGRAGTVGSQLFPQQATVRESALIEPLSEREQEVLRLLATALSGPEIADRLAISISTFRSHTKSIYGKLDAHSRLDAVARAEALHLL